MTYKTKYVKNLFTGEPFSFEVADKTIVRLEQQKKLIQSGHASMLGTIENPIQTWEFSFFPSFEELCKIWTENGYSDELMAQILEDFGVPDNFAQKLLEDTEFVEEIKPWFEGITCDGERAATTLKIIYASIKGYFSPKEQAST